MVVTLQSIITTTSLQMTYCLKKVHIFPLPCSIPTLFLMCYQFPFFWFITISFAKTSLSYRFHWSCSQQFSTRAISATSHHILASSASSKCDIGGNWKTRRIMSYSKTATPIKIGPNGQIFRLKALIVAKGYTQVYGLTMGYHFPIGNNYLFLSWLSSIVGHYIS